MNFLLQAKLRLLLTAMSLPQKKALEKIESKGDTIASHCLYLYLYPEAQEAAHWAKELSTRSIEVENCLRIKGNKKLSKSLFMEVLIEYPMGELQDYEVRYKQAVRHMEGKQPTRPSQSWDRFSRGYTGFIQLMYEDSFSSKDVLSYWAKFN